jgi:enoyl-CoA hydratase/carnithine racemase
MLAMISSVRRLDMDGRQSFAEFVSSMVRLVAATMGNRHATNKAGGGMAGKSVSIERSDNIAVVRLDRGGKANAMSFAIMDELADAALSFVDDISLRVVVLTGTERIFSAGMDLTDPFFDRLPDVPLEEVRHYSERGPRLARAWTQIEVPVICAVEGACMGGGLALAATADFRVASREARFAAPEVQVAHNMGWHSVPRLVALVGVQATRRVLLAGEEWSGEEAHRLGFADRVCEPGWALEEAMALARQVAAYPGLAVRMIKRQIDAAAHGQDVALSAYDKDQQMVAWLSEDFRAARQKFVR